MKITSYLFHVLTYISLSHIPPLGVFGEKSPSLLRKIRGSDASARADNQRMLEGFQRQINGIVVYLDALKDLEKVATVITRSNIFNAYDDNEKSVFVFPYNALLRAATEGGRIYEDLANAFSEVKKSLAMSAKPDIVPWKAKGTLVQRKVDEAGKLLSDIVKLLKTTNRALGSFLNGKAPKLPPTYLAGKLNTAGKIMIVVNEGMKKAGAALKEAVEIMRNPGVGVPGNAPFPVPQYAPQPAPIYYPPQSAPIYYPPQPGTPGNVVVGPSVGEAQLGTSTGSAGSFGVGNFSGANNYTQQNPVYQQQPALVVSAEPQPEPGQTDLELLEECTKLMDQNIPEKELPAKCDPVLDELHGMSTGGNRQLKFMRASYILWIIILIVVV